MSNTNEPTGRRLAEAAARAMGWTMTKWEAWYDTEGFWKGQADGPNPTEREMLAHLHKTGIVKTASSAIACDVKMSPRLMLGWADNIAARGRDLREALARLVVAVKEREKKA